MRKLIKEIPATEFKNYLRSIKSCKPGSVYELEGKYGIIHFNFSDFLAEKVAITFRRRSGNGVAVVVSGSTLLNIHVTSKVSQTITIPVHESGDVFIKRTQRSNGNLDVLSVSLWKEFEDGVFDWSSILRNCSKHSCIRMVGSNLIASEGAFIRGDIKEIQTDPPNMFKNDGKEVKFLGTCNIVNLKVSPENVKLISTNKKPPERVVHINPELPVIKKVSSVSNPVPKKLEKKQKIVNQEQTQNSHLLFDSSVHGFSKSFVNHDVKVHPKHIILGYQGEYKLPIRNAHPGRPYIITVEATKLSGNGRFVFNLKPSDDKKNRPLVSQGRRSSYQKKIITDKGCNFDLVVGRLNATGDVMINRVTLIEDSYIKPNPKAVIEKYVSYNKIDLISDISDESDPILSKSLRFSRFVQDWSTNDTLPYNCGFHSNSHKGIRWFNRISPIIPNVSIKDNPKLSIQIAGNIKYKSDNVFIEECFPDDFKESDFSELKKFKKIITPSEQIRSLLESKIEHENIHIGYKPWPLVEPVNEFPIPDNFILVFHRDKEITRRVLAAYEEGMPKIVLVGARGKYPHYVFPVNEYLSYPNLVGLITKAKAIVDISKQYEYDSGLFRLCMAYGTTTITSNWKAVEYTDGAIYVMPDDVLDNSKIPTIEAIKSALEDIKYRSRAPDMIEDYKVEFKEVMNLLFC
jgi:hypothetical protein